ncbi:TIGR03756 family integrating conjugative element protein [Escherichia coli]|uniref:TIGR03756 family integrating conjugative element protein n=1 Tax=Escherichia coli TaxID=562 RepID=UPI0021B37220|nr:TIGR03756 family integrating conjugative element protein [Escherichia coli]HAX2428597.1 TIGR03756 family integrating conjugative element protein [Escherichia coli]
MISLKGRLRAGALLLSVASLPLASASLNTASIIASAAAPDCISWRVSGICYWLYCSTFGCKVRTSVKVTHFIPEVVVSTYTAPGGNPWKEMSLVSRTAGGPENAITDGLSGLSAGGGNPADMKAQGERRSAIRFKYADALGHPATKLIGGMVPGFSCDSPVTPAMPYFLSTLDSIVWRTGLPESLYPEALVPGKREIGSQADQNMWGSVYPRSGFVMQTDDDRAAAVVAQRVADIITRTGEPHVYREVKGVKRDGYWPPEAVEENTGTRNHKWQRLTPSVSRSCAVFPDGEHQAAENGNAAFALWQPYSCCKKRGQRFLGSTNF